MTKLILFLLLFMTSNMAWSVAHYHGLQVDVKEMVACTLLSPVSKRL
jgi:hypothetical protein